MSSLATPPPELKHLLGITGVRFNGDQLWDITVYDPVVYQRILSQGSLGLGETYMDGLWDCPALDQLFTRLMSPERRELEPQLSRRVRLRIFLRIVHNRLQNMQSRKKAFKAVKHHYDVDNDLFKAMLDPTMSYSCAYWENADTLEQAQLNKLNMICQKLELKKGDKLLDIGCGWGGLARYAAEHYGVEVVGITLSKEQQNYAQDYCRGLPIEIKVMDYRDLSGKFDKIASIEMFEHVGKKNFCHYFDVISNILDSQGLFLLQTSGLYRTNDAPEPWLSKYIFPNHRVPSATDITRAIDGNMLIEDWHNFGLDYDHTLMAWTEQFKRIKSRLAPRYDERFCRMWEYYLLTSAAIFRSRTGQSWQIVFSKRTREQKYRSIRDFPGLPHKKT